MSTGSTGFYILIGAVCLVFLYIVSQYNFLVTLKNQVKNAWAQIDVQLKRRHDLIPNLVETVKGYAQHEKETLENVVKARNTAVGTKGDGAAKIGAENALTGALKSLFAVAENYPDLKANQNFLQLQEELTSTENKIGFARQFYNDMVLQYNNAKEKFPTNIVAGLFNFENREFFEIDSVEKAVPNVKF